AICADEDRGKNGETDDDDHRDRVDQSDHEEFDALGEVFAEVVPFGERILNAVDDVAHQTRKVSIDEKDADQECACQNENAAEEDLGDPAGIVERERERTQKIKGWA